MCIKGGLLSSLFVVLLVLSFSAFAADVEPSVEHAFANGEKEVGVIITLQETSSEEDAIQTVQQEVLKKLLIHYDFFLTNQYSSIPALAGRVTKEGFEKIKNDPLVKNIALDDVLSVILDDSVPQVNGNKVWNLSVAGKNITGSGETICVVDTGIDTDHTAFQDKIKSQYCYCSLTNADGFPCCPNNENEDSSAEDDNGHGTHVAGIAAGNYPIYTGMAKGADIVAIKVCSALGSCKTSDIISAVTWCTTNAVLYNISAISISIGGGGPYNNYCNSDPIAPAINAAVDKNISVVIAAGNNGYTTGISSPACVENATPVGAVNGFDAITYNRGNILELLAPGKSITAPYNTGGTATLSGTSMSTPHISGAIALLREYWRLAYGKIPSPQLIEKKLVLTGKSVYDSSSARTYARLDVLAALQPYLNFTAPTPADALSTKINAATVNITSDVDLSSALLEWTYPNGSTLNYSLSSQNGNAQEFSFSSTLSDGTHTYKIYGNDSANTFGTTVQRTLIIDMTAPQTIISSPGAGKTFNNGTLLFNATVTDAQLQKVQFLFTNGSGNDFIITPALADNVSNSWTSTLDVSIFSKGYQSMTVQANDTAGNTNATEIIYFTVTSLIVTPPSVVFVNPFMVHVEEKDYPLSSVTFAFDNATGIDFNRSAQNYSGNWSISGDFDTFVEGNHAVRAYATDSANQSNSTETLLFVIDRTPPAVTILSPLAGTSFAAATGNYSFNVSVNDLLLPTSLSVKFTLVPASGTAFNITPFNDSGIWKASYNVSRLPDGMQTLIVLASDLSGNMNSSQSVSFTVDGMTAPTVSLSDPKNNLFTSSASLSFMCSATDPVALKSLTLYGNWGKGWGANQTAAITGTSNQSTFSLSLSDGTYRWNCLAEDSAGHMVFAAANFTLTVDTVMPVISSITVSEISSGGATVGWTINEKANASVDYGTTQNLGTARIKTSFITAQSVGLSGLSAATLYYYKVTSCDQAGNCNSSTVQSFTTSAAENNGGSGGSSGGGGGGGGGGSTRASTVSPASTTTSTSAEKNPSSVSAVASEAVAEAAGNSEQTMPSPEISSGSFSQMVSFVKGEPAVISLNLASVVRSMEITSNNQQTGTVTVTALSEKPADLPELNRVYKYIEMTVGISPDDLGAAKVTFVVPLSWLAEQKYDAGEVQLQTFENGAWNSLKTKLVSQNEQEAVYTATVKHFSYFAITAAPKSPGLVGGAVAGLLSIVPEKINAKTLVLVGMGFIIVLLGGVYLWVRERED